MAAKIKKASLKVNHGPQPKVPAYLRKLDQIGRQVGARAAAMGKKAKKK